MKRALLAVLFAVSMIGTIHAQERLTDEQVAARLVGKWRQSMQTQSPLGPQRVESETVFLANGRFTSITVSGPYKFYCEGRWKMRNGLLVKRFTDWWPRRMRNVDGSDSPVVMPDSESTTIRFLDANRFKNKLGEAKRVR